MDFSTGVELSSKRCKKARTLDLRPHLARLDLKRRCFLGHNPKNNPTSSHAAVGRHDQHNSRHRYDSDVGDDSEGEYDGDEHKMEPIADSPPSRSIAALSPESDDLDYDPSSHGPHHHHHHIGPSLSLSPSPSPTMMLMSSSPSHRKALHSLQGSSSSYSDDDDGSRDLGRGGPTRRDLGPLNTPPTPSSSSFRRDRSSSGSTIDEEESKAGNEDKDSELAASEREEVSD